MDIFLLPLLAGFVLAGASAFTAAYSRRWGVRGGRLIASLLRNVLGIPLYVYGLVLAWNTGAPFATSDVGWLLIAAGSVPVMIGHLQLGWRTHMPELNDALMNTGLYAYMRHPIYAGALLIFIGLALLRPSVPWLLACALSCGFFSVMARLEEIDLLQRMPGYREYMAHTPRFLPRLPQYMMNRWLWLCPLAGLALAAAVLYLWGLSFWTAMLAALMLVCPAMILWGVIIILRQHP